MNITIKLKQIVIFMATEKKKRRRTVGIIILVIGVIMIIFFGISMVIIGSQSWGWGLVFITPLIVAVIVTIIGIVLLAIKKPILSQVKPLTE